MKEPGELEKLNAVAQAEASARSLSSLRWSSVFFVVVIGLAIAAGGSPLHRAVVYVSAALIIATIISVYRGWRYAPACAEAAWPISYAAFVLFSIHLTSWAGMVCLVAVIAGLVYSAIDGIRIALAINLASRPACASERDTVGRWILQLTEESTSPGIIQFSADDSWADGRVIVRLLRQENWIVVATLLEKNPTKLLTLSIFDARCAVIQDSPERKRLRIGDRKFRKVDFTPELTALADQLSQSSATV
jgi:hypothetical protein